MPELLVVSIALITFSLVLTHMVNVYAKRVNRKLDETLRNLGETDVRK